MHLLKREGAAMTRKIEWRPVLASSVARAAEPCNATPPPNCPNVVVADAVAGRADEMVKERGETLGVGLY